MDTKEPSRPTMSSRPTNARPGASSGNCYGCGKPGHQQADCPTKPKATPSSSKPPVARFRAIHEEGEDDHESSDCESKQDHGNGGESADEYCSGQSEDEQGDDVYDEAYEWFDSPHDGESEDEHMGFIQEDYDEPRDAVVEYMQAMEDEPTMDRPVRTGEQKACLVAEIKINGVRALTLFDLGCSMDSVTPAFAEVAKLRTSVLTAPLQLQLGTVGSWSQILRGTRSDLMVGPIREKKYYLDITNVAKYDAVIGTPFMWRHGLAIDFHREAITLPDGRIIQAR